MPIGRHLQELQHDHHATTAMEELIGCRTLHMSLTDEPIYAPTSYVSDKVGLCNIFLIL